MKILSDKDLNEQCVNMDAAEEDYEDELPGDEEEGEFDDGVETMGGTEPSELMRSRCYRMKLILSRSFLLVLKFISRPQRAGKRGRWFFFCFRLRKRKLKC